jgi:Glycosyl transferases group 1
MAQASAGEAVATSSAGLGESRVVLLSMRHLSRLVGYCAAYELEDIVAEVTGAEVVAPADLRGLDFSRRVYKATRLLTGSRRLAESLRPHAAARELTRNHDLFLAVFNHPYELFALNAIAGWRERCRVAACYLVEAWEGGLPTYLLELLRGFDHVFVGVRDTTEGTALITGRPCSYLPMGVDTLRFRPPRAGSPRAIDVCGIGRRSKITHEALLRLAEAKGLFYFYDTVAQAPIGRGLLRQVTFHVTDHREHRLLLANLLKRSRYFIANRAHADQPSWTRGVDEIAARFYEGAAAGAIMIGDPPETDDFRDQFGWPDSVVRMPFDAPDVADLIRQLDGDPGRTARIRRDNVTNALLRHDWVYRLRTVLETLGVPPPAPLAAREQTLRALAAETNAAPTATS